MYAVNRAEQEEVKCVSLLGIELDQNLRWNEHIFNLSTKLNKALFGISRISIICNRETTLSAYHALFHSVMTYGIVLWGGSNDINKILIIEKKAIRYVLHIPKRQSCREHFKTLGIQTAPSAYILEVLKRTKENYSTFENKCTKHDHLIRHRSDLQTNNTKLSTSQKSISFMGPKLFNKLPEKLRVLETKLFGRRVKALLLKQTFYSVQEFLQCNVNALYEES